MPIRLRSVLFLLVGVLAAAVLSACGGDGESASEDTDVNKLLTDTFGGKKKVESGKLNLSLAIDAQGSPQLQGPVTLKLTGPFQSLGDRKLPKFKMDAAFSGSGQNIKAGATSTGDRGFVNFNNTDYAVSDQVFKQVQAGYEQAQKEAAAEQKGEQPSLATLGIDPRKWLTNAKNEGEAKVGDADTIRITGGVDVPKLLDDVNKALEKAGQLGLQDSGRVPQRLTDEQRRQIEEGVKDLRVEIYTGKEDTTLRRMVVDLGVEQKAAAQAQSAKLKLDFSLTELNEDQEIAAPENTKPFDELLGQLGGLGGLGGAGGAGSGGTGSGGAGAGGATTDPKKLEEYTQCITDAGSDTAKAGECAQLLQP